MSRVHGLLIFGSVAFVVYACATAPVQDENIAAARDAIQRVESLPTASDAAAQELQAAHAALANAESLAAHRRSANAVANATYLAKRHADIAAEQITVAQAQRALETAERDRQAILSEARQRDALLQAQNTQQEAQRRVADANARAADANARAAQAEESKEQAEAATRDAQQANQKLAQLQQELAVLNAKKTDRGLVMTMGDVLFDTAKSTLKPGAVAPLDRLAKYLRDAPDRSVIVEGHTDSVGSEEYNQELSQRRADSVRQALVNRGVESDRVQAVGKGKDFPVASNNSAGGRQQNRRVEIVIENPA